MLLYITEANRILGGSGVVLKNEVGERLEIEVGERLEIVVANVAKSAILQEFLKKVGERRSPAFPPPLHHCFRPVSLPEAFGQFFVTCARLSAKVPEELSGG